MDSTGSVLTILVGLVARLLLPVGLTLGVAWLLGRLDRRWRAEAEAVGAVGARPIQVLRCWVLNDCPPEQQAKCPAHRQTNVPCWQLFRDQQGRLRSSCLDCDVFRMTPAAEAFHA
jgi:hypothetical protein